MRSQRGYRTCREPKSNWSAQFARSAEKYSDRGRTNERQRAVHPKLKTIVMASRSLGSCYSVKAVCVNVWVCLWRDRWQIAGTCNARISLNAQGSYEWNLKPFESAREREREAGGRWLCGACLNLYSDASCLAGLALSGFLVNFRACLPACLLLLIGVVTPLGEGSPVGLSSVCATDLIKKQNDFLKNFATLLVCHSYLIRLW